ncbi:pentapeptide repeat-containing protein [Polyangium sorediatum]|uniref:Pentapeptide repeat-containing protein n=1 Tax=Polyangium sorediatum TaxID=889274 RepID=A0ABT6P5D7_9BACT|nr:pentapeptide repeat-containing protein [Polyangium sorediatum]MDI1435825.1 pentapeptide repeat-containing protein [Polyangium sorediatum]
MNPFEGKSSFDSETFDKLTLERADLRDREFSYCTFRRCKLGESRWTRARLEGCVFEECDLSRADPTMLSLRGVTFTSCKLIGINWTKIAKFPDVSFEDCDLRYTVMDSLALRKTRFTRCAITESVFASMDFTDAVFEECRFAGTRFDGCDLRNARFPRSSDLFVDPAKNKVKGARVPLDTAILLATSFGMRVLGFDESKDE